MDVSMTEVPGLTFADLEPGDVFEFAPEESMAGHTRYGNLFMKLLPGVCGDEETSRFVGLQYYDTWEGPTHNSKHVCKLKATLEVTRNG